MLETAQLQRDLLIRCRGGKTGQHVVKLQGHRLRQGQRRAALVYIRPNEGSIQPRCCRHSRPRDPAELAANQDHQRGQQSRERSKLLA